MKNTLPVLPVLWLAWGPAFTPAAEPAAVPQPQSLVRQAVTSLEAHEYVSAKIRHEVHLFNRHLMGSGVYMEQRSAREHMIRLELKIQLGENSSSVVQVCDGRYLYEHRKLGAESKLTRIDVVQLTRALQQAKPSSSPSVSSLLPGLGGLPRLLRGLDAAFDFTAAEAGTWGRQKRAVWRLEGTWKRDRLAWMLPAQKAAMEAGKAPDLSKLPEHLPDRVVLYLGQDDMFPYRVEYHRRKADEDEDTPARPLVVMELYDVALNVPISRSHFTYSPGNAEFTDQTEAYIKALGGK